MSQKKRSRKKREGEPEEDRLEPEEGEPDEYRDLSRKKGSRKKIDLSRKKGSRKREPKEERRRTGRWSQIRKKRDGEPEVGARAGR